MEVNLVLSGGGARGLAHLGVIKCLQEKGFSIRAISGVSSGAIAGAFFASGLSPDEILQIAKENADFHLRKPPFTLGFFSKTNLERVLLKYFPENSFSKLAIPLYISAMNINTGLTEYFSSGELIKPLIASTALPIIFSAVEMNGNQYLDGGLINNLPVEPFLEEDLPIIGVYVNPIAKVGYISSSLRIIERSIELAVHKNISSRKKHCTLFIEPPDLRLFSIYDFSRASEIFNMGYEYSKTYIDAFLEKETKDESKRLG